MIMLYMEDDGKPMDLSDFDDLKGEKDDRPSNFEVPFFSWFLCGWLTSPWHKTLYVTSK
jgi:hypothetical protein